MVVDQLNTLPVDTLETSDDIYTQPGETSNEVSQSSRENLQEVAKELAELLKSLRGNRSNSRN